MNDPQPEGHMASHIERRKFLATLLGGAAVAWPLAARALPIVMLAIDYDPIARRLVTCLCRPTGYVIGMHVQQIELAEKRVQILRDAFPDLSSAITFWDELSADQWHATQTAAATLGFPLAGVKLHDPPYDYEHALAQFRPNHRSCLMVMVSAFFFRDRAMLAELALRHRIVSMFGFREWAEAGGLLSYGPNIIDMHRRIADYEICRPLVEAGLARYRCLYCGVCCAAHSCWVGSASHAQRPCAATSIAGGATDPATDSVAGRGSALVSAS